MVRIGGPGLAERQTAQQPEDRERQDADIDSGDHQDVIRAGALEVGLDVAPEKCASADQRRLHQRATLARPKPVDVLQCAAPGCAAPHVPAGCRQIPAAFNAARRAPNRSGEFPAKRDSLPDPSRRDCDNYAASAASR